MFDLFVKLEILQGTYRFWIAGWLTYWDFGCGSFSQETTKTTIYHFLLLSFRKGRSDLII